ncbi:MAG: FAD-linked oxidase C-terminal domain-containing protein [bacterium]
MSGEHGIGLAHKEMLAAQQPELIDLFRQLKKVFDPRGILNPGKLFDL